LELARLRRSHWYYPALDHTDWAAWGAVVELALRRRIAAWQKSDDCTKDWQKGWKKDGPWLSPAVGSHPAVLYSRGVSRPTPNCLTVRLRSPGSYVQVAAVRGACRRHRVWELDYGQIPWRREKKNGTPGASMLWKWAHRPLAQIEGGPFEEFF
jgi:hypothetical protein